MKKLDEQNSGYLNPGVQKRLVECIREDPKLLGEGLTPEETLAEWIYRDVLAPLGW